MTIRSLSSGRADRTRNVYNAFGYLKEVRQYLASDDARPISQLQGALYWQADSYDAAGRINGEIYGNGLVNDRVYSEATGRLRTAIVGRGTETATPYSVQYLTYTHDAVGNIGPNQGGHTLTLDKPAGPPRAQRCQ